MEMLRGARTRPCEIFEEWAKACIIGGPRIVACVKNATSGGCGRRLETCGEADRSFHVSEAPGASGGEAGGAVLASQPWTDKASGTKGRMSKRGVRENGFRVSNFGTDGGSRGAQQLMLQRHDCSASRLAARPGLLFSEVKAQKACSLFKLLWYCCLRSSLRVVLQ